MYQANRMDNRSGSFRTFIEPKAAFYKKKKRKKSVIPHLTTYLLYDPRSSSSSVPRLGIGGGDTRTEKQNKKTDVAFLPKYIQWDFS